MIENKKKLNTLKTTYLMRYLNLYKDGIEKEWVDTSPKDKENSVYTIVIKKILDTNEYSDSDAVVINEIVVPMVVKNKQGLKGRGLWKIN